MTLFNKANNLLRQFPMLHRPVMQLENQLFELSLLYNLHVRNKTPLIIYQMGKVGSQSIYYSFPTQQYDLVISTHSMNPEIISSQEQWRYNAGVPPHRELYRGRSLYYHVAKPRRKARYITPIREPLGRNLSEYFQGFHLHVGMPYKKASYSVEQLTELYLSDKFPHDKSLSWFDVEYKEILDIDVFNYPFPHEKGYLRIRKEHADVLLLRVELDDAIKEKAISEFLNIPNFKLSSANIGEKKEYADTYRQFKNRIVLPEDYINRMIDAKFTKHFYLETEREKIRQQWLSRIP